ncbi:MAG TPA: hypothetical protein ENL34_10895 [Chloroflexi bacterium]|nr:hypothetical protein [Chloroflexota bacterium]
MIPKPANADSKNGSYRWPLSEGVDLWWWRHSADWGLVVGHAPVKGVTASITIDLGVHAPPALLLMAHNAMDRRMT